MNKVLAARIVPSSSLAILPQNKAAIDSSLEQPESDYGSGVIYELVPVHELPSLDPTKTVKSLLFSEKQLEAINRIGYRGRLPISVAFLIGDLLSFGAITLPAAIARPVSFLALALVLPGEFFTTIAMRYEILRLLARTYDFWFFTFANLLYGTSFLLLFHDIRVPMLLNGIYLTQMGISVDSQLGNLRSMVVTSIFNVVVYTALFVIVFLRLADVDDASHLVMFRYSHNTKAVTTREVLLNSIFNLILMFARVWYRKRTALSEQVATNRVSASRSSTSTTGNSLAVSTKCVSYRCHLRLQVKQCAAMVVALAPPLNGSAAASPHDSRQRATLLAVLYTCGIVGSVSNCAAWISDWFQLPCNSDAVQLLSVAGSTVFCCTFIACHQAHLVLQLYKSFDFVFLTAKVVTAMLCVFRSLQWERKALTVGVSFLWMYWLLTLDAVTPRMRARLAFRVRFAGFIGTAVIALHVLLLLELLWLNRWSNSDTLLLKATVGGREIIFDAVSILLSQLWMTLAWFCRILWRIATASSEDEMLLLLGQVGYDSLALERNRKIHRSVVLQKRASRLELEHQQHLKQQKLLGDSHGRERQ
ncbi:hypothetical protein PybrP1_001475 [[Pythium] brassicae (nom. inval.)]|nr:hypothetical protein PybrP1_001475 [[Pythium] brassicae (nom. inval.)]